MNSCEFPPPFLPLIFPLLLCYFATLLLTLFCHGYFPLSLPSVDVVSPAPFCWFAFWPFIYFFNDRPIANAIFFLLLKQIKGSCSLISVNTNVFEIKQRNPNLFQLYFKPLVGSLQASSHHLKEFWHLKTSPGIASLSGPNPFQPFANTQWPSGPAFPSPRPFAENAPMAWYPQKA